MALCPFPDRHCVLQATWSFSCRFCSRHVFGCAQGKVFFSKFSLLFVCASSRFFLWRKLRGATRKLNASWNVHKTLDLVDVNEKEKLLLYITTMLLFLSSHRKKYILASFPWLQKKATEFFPLLHLLALLSHSHSYYFLLFCLHT